MPLLILLFCLLSLCQNVSAEEVKPKPFFGEYQAELSDDELLDLKIKGQQFWKKISDYNKEFETRTSEYKNAIKNCNSISDLKERLLCVDGEEIIDLNGRMSFCSDFIMWLFIENKVSNNKIKELTNTLNRYTEYQKDPKKAKYD